MLTAAMADIITKEWLNTLNTTTIIDGRRITITEFMRAPATELAGGGRLATAGFTTRHIRRRFMAIESSRFRSFTIPPLFLVSLSTYVERL